MLQIYNTLTRQKETFKPLKPGKVNMYVCGMTVYDYCHVGHARVFVVFDMVSRYLRARGYEVKYVVNITDIDDKIIKRANENQEDFFQLGERFIKAMQEDRQSLNVLPPNVEPRATQYIPQMIAMIETLIAKEFAYVADNGDVYYEVSRFKNYGELAHQAMDKLRAGVRVEVADVKRDPLDFVLWKMAKPGEPSWDSPWGKGRPGWHIECSAMSTEQLGVHFDIHGGGLDLQFPHHQNEIAQSEATTGCKFVNTWMHVGFVQVDQEKMSKSLGNFSTIRDVLAKYPAEVIRYFILASHYRSPINYSAENLNSAKSALERFYLTLRDFPSLPKMNLEENEFAQRFFAAMDDDFNTPIAIAVLFDLVREINRYKEEGDRSTAEKLAVQLKQLAEILGILQHQPNEFLQQGINTDQQEKVTALIAARNAARANKNWPEADRVRQELQAMGIELEDTAAGTVWRRVE